MIFRYAKADGSYLDTGKICPLKKDYCSTIHCACFEVCDKEFGYCGLTAARTRAGAGLSDFNHAGADAAQ